MNRRTFLKGLLGFGLLVAANPVSALTQFSEPAKTSAPVQAPHPPLTEIDHIELPKDPLGQRAYVGAYWWKAVMIENHGWMSVERTLAQS